MKLGCSALVCAVSLLAACSGDPDDGDITTKVVEAYAEHVYRSYDTALFNAQNLLQPRLDAFLANPNEITHREVKQAWVSVRESYGVTEVFRFYDGPIDNPVDGPEPRLNAWPLDEAYIDYVVGMPNAGIVNDPAGFPTITIDVIKEQNENGGEANISAGYHAIEFLLWGQDLSPTGPGERPYTDFVTSGGTAANQDRRRAYLQLATQLLIEDLAHVTEQWAPDADNYRAEFVAGGKGSIQKILLGMGSLSGAELSGERMTVALDNRDQEDEHSCFSDNTHKDLFANAVGIEYVAGIIDELVRAKNPALADKLKMEVEASVTAIMAIPPPFDQAIMNDAGRALVTAAIQALQTQTETTVDAATALGVTINLQ